MWPNSSNMSLVTTTTTTTTTINRFWRTKRRRFKRHLAVRIADLKRVCDLDDKQTKKLEVASKGAVEEAMELFRAAFSAIEGASSAGSTSTSSGGRVWFSPRTDSAGRRPAACGGPAPPADVPVELMLKPQLMSSRSISKTQTSCRCLKSISHRSLRRSLPRRLSAPKLVPAQPPVIWNVNVHQDFQMEPSEAANTVIWRNAVRAHRFTEGSLSKCRDRTSSVQTENDR